MARGLYFYPYVLITLCFGYSIDKPYYMDQFCDQSIYLKDHEKGLDLHLTESDVYESDLNCSVRLVARTHHHIAVTFIYLDVSSFVSCPEDYLAIGECPPDDHCEGACCVLSSLYCCHQHNRRTTKYCGVAVPTTSYTSVSNVIGLNFISDDQFFGKGFHLYVTTFHEGACLAGESRCQNGRCIPESLHCSKGDNCGDGSDSCMSMFPPSVIAGFVVGGVIIILALSIALVIVWYHRKHGVETHRYMQRQERYIRRYSTPSPASRTSYTNQIIFTTPPLLPSFLSVVSSTSSITETQTRSSDRGDN